MNILWMSIFFIFVLIPFTVSAHTPITFAIIGDYGKSGPNELYVSNLVKSWNPDFIITLGDNNYELGEEGTIDQNIGQFYHQFIYPYLGSYGTGDTINSFFPSLGNHDWYTAGAAPYLSYFTLPSNERYYDFVKGDIHFFCIDSDSNEPDGVDSSSLQAQWLKNSLANSSQKYNLIYFHHPAYSSGLHGNTAYMQWPFKAWGATAVLSGHDHHYERIFYKGMLYFVNGLGGKSIYPTVFPVIGSQIRYFNNYGAMKADCYSDSLVFRFYSIGGDLRDYFKILPAQKVLTLTALLEGFYYTLTNKMVSDTAYVYLRNTVSPFSVIDSAKGILDSTGSGIFNFTRAENITGYYLIVKHRNSIETWSAGGNSFSANVLDYDFTASASQAFGNNEKLKGTKYCIYSGDVNRDGQIQLNDILLSYNDASVFLQGYSDTDVNGDDIVNLSDLLIVYNNSLNFIMKIRP